MEDSYIESKYREVRPVYEDLSYQIKNILLHSIPNDIPIHSITHRAKEVDSFLRKSKKVDHLTGKSKYADPMKEITDLAGVRIIVYFPRTLQDICNIIEANFKILEKKDLGKERFEQGKFGYQSIHYLVEMAESRIKLPEYNRFKSYVAELQVRTILQHAWAEMEHDIQYKSSAQIPTTIKRRFVALAGMLEIADREFQAIQDEDLRLKTSLSESLIEDFENDNSFSKNNNVKIKELIQNKKYKEAIDEYTKKIADNPKMYTLYLGRAKAKFLNGDGIGAKKDLKEARSKTDKRNWFYIDNVEQQIIEGKIDIIQDSSKISKLVKDGNKYLSEGDGEKAFQQYSKAQVLGLPQHYANFDKAMARIVVKDFDGASFFIDQINPDKNTHFEINYLALKAICGFMSNKKYSEYIKNIQNINISFNYNKSPLIYLEKGFIQKDGALSGTIKSIFDLLKGLKIKSTD